jgi:hypothetical protein
MAWRPVSIHSFRPPRGTLGNKSQTRQPVAVAAADDDLGSVDASEAVDDEDAVEIEDDTDADIEIDPDLSEASWLSENRT